MTPSDILPYYLEACAWAESGEDSSPLGRIPPDFADDAKEEAAIRCESFLHENPDVGACGLGAEAIGHDLWLTSQGHGTGFWDRGLPYDMGQRLTKRAKLEHADAYIGDDGLIHLT